MYALNSLKGVPRAPSSRLGLYISLNFTPMARAARPTAFAQSGKVELSSLALMHKLINTRTNND